MSRASKAESPTATSLYERDPYAWSLEQARLLREGRLDEVDIVNVADEILSVGKQQLSTLENLLIAIVKDMLVWEGQPDQRSPHREKAIAQHRRAIAETLGANPSLSLKRGQALDWSYSIARLQASSETDTDLAQFPETCPYDWDTILNRPFQR